MKHILTVILVIHSFFAILSAEKDQSISFEETARKIHTILWTASQEEIAPYIKEEIADNSIKELKKTSQEQRAKFGINMPSKRLELFHVTELDDIGSILFIINPEKGPSSYIGYIFKKIDEQWYVASMTGDFGKMCSTISPHLKKTPLPPGVSKPEETALYIINNGDNPDAIRNNLHPFIRYMLHVNREMEKKEGKKAPAPQKKDNNKIYEVDTVKIEGRVATVKFKVTSISKDNKKETLSSTMVMEYHFDKWLYNPMATQIGP